MLRTEFGNRDEDGDKQEDEPPADTPASPLASGNAADNESMTDGGGSNPEKGKTASKEKGGDDAGHGGTG